MTFPDVVAYAFQPFRWPVKPGRLTRPKPRPDPASDRRPSGRCRRPACGCRAADGRRHRHHARQVRERGDLRVGDVVIPDAGRRVVKDGRRRVVEDLVASEARGAVAPKEILQRGLDQQVGGPSRDGRGSGDADGSVGASVDRSHATMWLFMAPCGRPAQPSRPGQQHRDE